MNVDTDLLGTLRAELHSINADVPHDLAADAPLDDTAGVDSLDLLEFVARLEFEFGFLVPDGDWQGLTTLATIADYIRARVE